jgi:hypothetical protein
MQSYGMWRRVVLVRTNVWEGRVASIFRVERMNALRIALAVTIIIATSIMFEELCLLGCYACGSCKNRRFGGT